MLVMISQPMNGKTYLDIQNERAEVIEKLNKLHIDVLDTVFEEEAPVNSNQGAYFLAKSIDAMSRVDAVYFMKDWQNARGCRIERQVAKEYDISGGMLRNWIIKYNQYGEDSLVNQKKPGNPLMKYSAKKNLTDIEKLQYENMKLRIENERLKKGYLVKGDGSVVVFKK